jgi:hypothetical protein
MPIFEALRAVLLMARDLVENPRFGESGEALRREKKRLT